ncbi:hypothetical protein NQ314_008916 [Rhamnusium bicolor]|uniref:Uncharacterized protein n=1 Tax=Rhamnusium bicolor TaxID=1586634 RepID=A0AAV8Y657_9CUCU|nr:hypothetical protein NQ314_008916 [Rhamnusium bicolor]
MSNLLDKISADKSERYFNNIESFSWMDENFKERKLAPEKSVLFKRILLEDDKKAKIKKT